MTGQPVTLAAIEEYMAELERRGRSKGTLYTYRRKMEQLYALLPEDKLILSGTLQQLREDMISEGTPNSTINIFCAAVNGFLDFSGRRDLQVREALDQAETIPPELTRGEYLRLLSAARTMEARKTYLLIKIFANTGLYVRELSLITAEAMREGRVFVPQRGIVYLPKALCSELLDYCGSTGCIKGPVFTTATGKALNRGAVNAMIRRLSEPAKVEQEKCNPLTLRRLYLSTQEGIQRSLALLMEQSNDRLFEQEQLIIGW